MEQRWDNCISKITDSVVDALKNCGTSNFRRSDRSVRFPKGYYLSLAVMARGSHGLRYGVDVDDVHGLFLRCELP